MYSSLAIPAAQYLRVSRAHRDCPLEVQVAFIKAYAERFNFAIVRTYADPGKSGLKSRNRPGFTALLQDVLSGKAPYRAVLVYDITRWGRFQNTDEAAHYEFLCESAGISVHYCNEAFANDSSPLALVQKSLRRIMAADYSRKLSNRCFQGQKKLAELGFCVGGPPGFGFRRVLVGEDGKPPTALRAGEYKSLSTDRVILIPGPKEEIQQVRKIFAMVLKESKGPTEIARVLNRRGIPRPDNRLWTREMVRDILGSPKYAGLNVWNRRTIKLGTSAKLNPPEQWITTRQAFRPLVSWRHFKLVQQKLKRMAAQRTEAELILQLRNFVSKWGKVSTEMMTRKSGLGARNTYLRHFGSLQRAYDMVGYNPTNRFNQSDSRKRRRIFQARVVNQLMELYGPLLRVQRGTNDNSLLVRIGKGPTIAIRVCSKVTRLSGHLRWSLNLGVHEQNQDLDLVCLLNERNESFYRFYLTLAVSRKPQRRLLRASDAILTSGFQVRDLRYIDEAVDQLMRPAATH